MASLLTISKAAKPVPGRHIVVPPRGHFVQTCYDTQSVRIPRSTYPSKLTDL